MGNLYLNNLPLPEVMYVTFSQHLLASINHVILSVGSWMFSHECKQERTGYDDL